MPKSMSFEELIAALPRPALRADTLPDGLRYVDEPNPAFVAPRLEVDDNAALASAPVVLVSAPAAVGKSTLAAAIAQRTGASLWNLAEFNVGTKTFHGTIVGAFSANVASALQSLTQGNLLVVLDALDEAQIRAGDQNFRAFLNDIIALSKQWAARPCVVMLARAETADWVELFFDDANAKGAVARCTVQFFDRSAAQDFLDKRIDVLSKGRSPHRAHRETFEAARDELFQIVYALLGVSGGDAWAQPMVPKFLGYAPVLEAIATSFAPPDRRDPVEGPFTVNYRALVNSLKDGDVEGRDQWRFLLKVIESVLARERTKLVQALRPSLAGPAAAAKWSDWDSLYSNDEQCERVLRYMLHAPPISRQLPAAVATIYEQAVGDNLPQHAFIEEKRQFTNVVFREYAYAWALASAHGTLSDQVRARLQQRDGVFLPSPLFGRFLTALSSRAAADGRARVAASDVGALYESFATNGRDVSISVIGEGDEADCFLTIANGTVEELVVHVDAVSRGFGFWRRLSKASVDVEAPVCLGLKDGDFLLGPGVDISCTTLRIVSSSLTVHAPKDVGVSLFAKAYDAEGSQVRLSVFPARDGELAAYWRAITYPWVAYRVPPRVEPPAGSSPRRRELIKLLLMFRRQRRRTDATLRTARLSPEDRPLRDELLSLAERQGILARAPLGNWDFVSSFASLFTLLGPGDPVLTPEAAAFVAAFRAQ
jgi:hypothetical protein